MSDLDDFYGPNAGYVLDLYDRYQQDPDAVDPATRAAFQNWTPAAAEPVYRNGTAATLASTAPSISPPPAPNVPAMDVMKVVGAARVTRLVRELGHLTAHIDPLGSEPPGDSSLELATHGLTTEDLARHRGRRAAGPRRLERFGGFGPTPAGLFRSYRLRGQSPPDP